MFSPIPIIGINVIPGLLLIQGVIFLVVLWLLNRVLFKPILEILQGREERTEGFLSEAEEIGKRAEKTLEQYNERLYQAKKEALDLKRKLILEGTEKKEAILNRVRKEAQGFIEEMRSNITQEAEKTKKTLHQQVETLGKIMAAKALGRNV